VNRNSIAFCCQGEGDRGVIKRGKRSNVGETIQKEDNEPGKNGAQRWGKNDVAVCGGHKANLFLAVRGNPR